MRTNKNNFIVVVTSGLIGWLFILVTGCLGNAASKKSNSQVMNDTVFVIVDSTSINKKENTFYFALIYKEKEKTYEVYREKNRDYSIEFEFNFHFADSEKDYLSFSINDLPTGLKWDIIYNKKTKIFYRTDAYDKKALGDELIKSSMNFKDETAFVKSNEPYTQNYTVKLNLIWEPSDTYKGRTIRGVH
ncbi:MAG TPA: hypothetical protein VFU05_14795 [Cyclobacteriaceae bacterium]|nr:hypothetical protein [Cyclobacteriaceae bacterium]